jgi:hypothetical protein
VVSTATVSAATEMPLPAPTLSVLLALSVPPPVNPLPAITCLLQLVEAALPLILPTIVLVKVLVPPIL